jgi:hypothetical protein
VVWKVLGHPIKKDNIHSCKNSHLKSSMPCKNIRLKSSGRTLLFSQILLVPMPNPPQKSEEDGKKIICSLKYLIVDCP